MSALDDLAALVKKVPVEGTPYFLRVMTGTDWVSWTQYVRARPESDEIQLIDNATMLVRTICDSDGKRLFTDADAEAIVNTVDAKTLLDMFRRASDLNRLSEVIEEEKKDSAPIQS